MSDKEKDVVDTLDNEEKDVQQDTADEKVCEDNKEKNVEDSKVKEAEDEVKEEEASTAQTEEDKADDKKESKMSKFKKPKKKDKKDEQIEELKDRLVRNMAEFDNFRKRTEKEKSQMFEIGAKSVIEKILPVVDNFERALDAATKEEKETPFVQGIDKIYNHMMTTLEEVGVKPIEAVGKEFDPNLHNAVMHDEDEEMGENTVSEEFQKGYMYKESVVRHSMVKVVN